MRRYALRQTAHLRGLAYSWWLRGVKSLHLREIFTAVWWTAVTLLVLSLVLVLVIAVLWCCFVGGLGTSVIVRNYFLSGVPENQVLPVELELAPVESDSWRWRDVVENRFEHTWATTSGKLIAATLRDIDTQHTQDTHRTTTTTTTSKQRTMTSPPPHSNIEGAHEDLREGCGAAGPTWATRSEDDDCSTKHSGTQTSTSTTTTTTVVPEAPTEISVKEAVVRSLTHAATTSAEVALRHQIQLHERRLHALLLNGGVRFHGGGGGASSSAPDDDTDSWLDELVGGTSGGSLFLPLSKPLFNAHGSYSADMQLVYLTENHARQVSLSVHVGMLAEKEVPRSRSGGGGGKNVVSVFDRRQGTSVVTGEATDTESSWVERFVQRWALWVFSFPRYMWQLAWSLMDEGCGPFPPLAADGSERAVRVPLYQNFHPPMRLQRHLKALNVTVWQRGEVSASESAVNPPLLHIVRAHVAFSVELEGIAYFLSAYPLLSTAVLTAFFFVSFALWSACVAVGIVSGGVYLAMLR